MSSVVAFREPISIHALREEGDLTMAFIDHDMSIFQSTPSARRATSAWCAAAMTSSFQSTPSARRATRFKDFKCCGK